MNDTTPEIPLYNYQRRAVRLIAKRGGSAALFMAMGVGKSRTALASLTDSRVILIVCPVNAAGVWRKEIVDTLNLPYKILDITDSESLKIRSSKVRRTYRYTGKYVVIVNPEAYWREPLRRALREMPLDAVIIDEGQRIKHRYAKQSRFAHAFGQREDLKRLLLTGSKKKPEDIFSMYKYLDPTVFGDNWADFERRYLIKGGFHGHQTIGYQNLDELDALLEKTSFTIGREVLKLKEPKHVIVPIKMSAKLRKLYDQFSKDSIATFEGLDDAGETAHGDVIAQIVLTAMIRKQQMTSGFVKTEDDRLLDVGNEKLKICVELTEDALSGDEKVVIFFRFTRDLKRLLEKFPSAGVIAGGKRRRGKTEDVQRVIRGLNSGRSPVLLVQIQTAQSFDLTAATVGIYYSTDLSVDHFEQARDRLHRHGQKNVVTYYHLQIENSIDGFIYDTLTSQEDVRVLARDPEYARNILNK